MACNGYGKRCGQRSPYNRGFNPGRFDGFDPRGPFDLYNSDYRRRPCCGYGLPRHRHHLRPRPYDTDFYDIY